MQGCKTAQQKARDKREHANNLVAEEKTAARQGDLKTLYNNFKQSGRLKNNDRPVRIEEGKRRGRRIA